MKWKAARLSVVLLCSGTALEAQTSWIDGVGDWFNFFNWSNGVPNSGSATSFDAQINNGGIAQIFSPGASVRRITLGNLSGQGGGLLVDLGSLNVTENLRLGENGGMGNMTIRNDADVSASQTILGVFSGSGLMTVSGNGSTLTSSTLILAELASGTMVVRDGGDVSGFYVSLANASTSALGRLTVTGTGSTLTADDTLWIGRAGVGEVTVDTGGAVTAPIIDMGSNTFGNGFVTVTGAGSTITSTNTFLVGNNGVGTLIVSAGGRANSIAMGVGFMSNSFGTVTVTGAGSRLVDTFNSIYIGYDGAGTLNIADGGIVTVNSGFGTVVVGGTANGGASTLRIGQGAAPGTLQANSVSLFRANSQLELNHTGIIAFTPVISGSGSVIQVANGTTTLTANNTFTGPVTVRVVVPLPT
ncbi:MAG TPA: hypothetical protein VFD27_11895 [Chthoniobacteraceae bacterium]|nr:hypothetical protein [Chthoniobacteraceae bacterium]